MSRVHTPRATGTSIGIAEHSESTLASSAPVGAASTVLAFIDKHPQKLKARGCRNALVSDAYLQSSARRWGTGGPQQRSSKRHANAGGAQIPSTVRRRKFSGRAAVCRRMRPPFAFSSAIRKSCDSAGLRIVVPSEQDPAFGPRAFDEALKNSWWPKTGRTRVSLGSVVLPDCRSSTR